MEGGWTPESKAAHVQRLEFAKLMGLGCTSITNPQYLIARFKGKVEREERERCAKLAESLKCSPEKESPEVVENWNGACDVIAEKIREGNA